MITCNRCGSLSPANAMNCQNCGEPLSGSSEMGPARFFQDQPELPAWLESLRAGERSAAPADSSTDFSTADLIEEGSLPSWMRSGRSGTGDTGLSSPHLPLQPSSIPGPNTDDSRGLNAKSLIDEQSLPSWMQENKEQSTSIPEGGIPASSLVQRDIMPDWMKSLQQNVPASNAAPPSAQQMPPPASPISGQSAFPAMNEDVNEFSARPAQGFSARGLVDEQSLPSWMQQQEGNPSPSAQPSAGNLLSPSSLIDVNSLPSWLQESAQQGQRNGGQRDLQANNPWSSPQSAMGQGSSPVWQPAAPQMPPTPPMNSGQGMAASSFIDSNALPEWLRNAGQQNMPGGAAPFQRPDATARGGYNVPPRVENVRVPSRPRGEVNANESNEAAANVFASMLGVASTAPNFPGAPPPQGYGMQGGGFGQGAPVPQQPPTQGPIGNMPGNMMGGAPTEFNNSQRLQGPPPGQSYVPNGFNGGMYQGGNQGQGNYPMGNSFPGTGASPYAPGNPGFSGALGNTGTDAQSGQKTSTKPAKKGIFDVIRDWFR